MLSSTPKAGVEETNLWNSMYATNISIFESHWDEANKLQSTDNDMWADVTYSSWDCDGAKCQGTRFLDRNTRHLVWKHGIVRTEWLNGTVEEATWNQNRRHGLRRFIDDKNVEVELWSFDLM